MRRDRVTRGGTAVSAGLHAQAQVVGQRDRTGAHRERDRHAQWPVGGVVAIPEIEHHAVRVDRRDHRWRGYRRTVAPGDPDRVGPGTGCGGVRTRGQREAASRAVPTRVGHVEDRKRQEGRQSQPLEVARRNEIVDGVRHRIAGCHTDRVEHIVDHGRTVAPGDIDGHRTSGQLDGRARVLVLELQAGRLRIERGVHQRALDEHHIDQRIGLVQPRLPARDARLAGGVRRRDSVGIEHSRAVDQLQRGRPGAHRIASEQIADQDLAGARQHAVQAEDHSRSAVGQHVDRVVRVADQGVPFGGPAATHHRQYRVGGHAVGGVGQLEAIGQVVHDPDRACIRRGAEREVVGHLCIEGVAQDVARPQSRAAGVELDLAKLLQGHRTRVELMRPRVGGPHRDTGVARIGRRPVGRDRGTQGQRPGVAARCVDHARTARVELRDMEADHHRQIGRGGRAGHLSDHPIDRTARHGRRRSAGGRSTDQDAIDVGPGARRRGTDGHAAHGARDARQRRELHARIEDRRQVDVRQGLSVGDVDIDPIGADVVRAGRGLVLRTDVGGGQPVDGRRDRCGRGRPEEGRVGRWIIERILAPTHPRSGRHLQRTPRVGERRDPSIEVDHDGGLPGRVASERQLHDHQPIARRVAARDRHPVAARGVAGVRMRDRPGGDVGLRQHAFGEGEGAA